MNYYSLFPYFTFSDISLNVLYLKNTTLCVYKDKCQLYSKGSFFTYILKLKSCLMADSYCDNMPPVFHGLHKRKKRKKGANESEILLPGSGEMSRMVDKVLTVFEDTH